MKVIKNTASKKPAFYTAVHGVYKPTVGEIATTHAKHEKEEREIQNWFVKKKSNNSGISLKKK